MQTKKVKTSSLIIGLTVGFIFSILMGVTAGARGFGSIYPQLNLIVSPFVCPNGQMTYAQNVSEVGSATYYAATWFCEDEQSGEKQELDHNTVFLSAGLIYGIVFFIVLLLIVQLYWNSSMGPARNNGLRLW